MKVLEEQVADRDAQLVGVCRERQRADELPKERDSQLLAERATWGVTHQAHLEKGTLVHPFFKAP